MFFSGRNWKKRWRLRQCLKKCIPVDLSVTLTRQLARCAPRNCAAVNCWHFRFPVCLSRNKVCRIFLLYRHVANDTNILCLCEGWALGNAYNVHFARCRDFLIYKLTANCVCPLLVCKEWDLSSPVAIVIHVQPKINQGCLARLGNNHRLLNNVMLARYMCTFNCCCRENMSS